MLAERIWPAVPSQRSISPGFVDDALWLNIGVLVGIFVSPLMVGGAVRVWEHLANGYRLPWLSAVPLALRAICVLIVYDAMEYALHWIHHKVPPLWHIHAVHHSQEELNPLTGSRHHIFEYVTSSILIVVPMLLLGMTTSAMLLTTATRIWIDRLQHANLRWDFGPLGAILVSPHYHRIHHSRDRQHHDCNYGNFLTVWDRIFGTMHRAPGVYPVTGLDGVHWRAPSEHTPRGAVLRTIEQLWYPIRRITHGGWRGRG